MKDSAPCHIEFPDRTPGARNATLVQARILRELEVHEDVCPGLGVDQASVLICDVAIDTMEKRAMEWGEEHGHRIKDFLMRRTWGKIRCGGWAKMLEVAA